MDKKKEEFLKKLRATFRIEAEEHVRAISAGLMELEKTPAQERRAEVIETIFRDAHSLKGAARSVNLQTIESICQLIESVFSELKKQEVVLSTGLYDVLHSAMNTIAALVSETGEEVSPALQSRSRELISQLKDVSGGAGKIEKQKGPAPSAGSISSKDSKYRTKDETHAGPDIPPEKPAVMAGTVRIPTSKLDPLLLQAEEMIMFKMAAEQRTAELREINSRLDLWMKESDRFKNRQECSELFAWNWERLNALQSQAAAAARSAEQDQRSIRRLVDEHLESVKNVLMLPVSTLAEVFPKLIRDLARGQGKEVELVIQGAEIEIDKRILEELKDPLVHLIRNCVDHGIKKTSERALEKKPPGGKILLKFAVKDNRQMEISLSDDGTGVELDKVRSAAVKMGLLPEDPAKHPGPEEILQFIFHSGISTSPIITDISGRGLGLAIVREKAEKLGGTVSVESRPGTGTAFRLLVPMTLATFRGVLVKLNETLFVLPAVNVERVLRVRKDDIKTVENRETINLDGQILPMVSLYDVLKLPSRQKETAKVKSSGREETIYMPVIILTSAEKRMAFQVDEVLQEQEVLVKGLGAQLKRVRNIAGATVLGTGKAVPVLNVQDLMKSAIRSAGAAQKEPPADKTAAGKGRVLVAEDSITSRALLKNILETAGYIVATAVDGADALTQARNNEFDLVVSDVDMPRLNGFELTARIRADKKLSELPVVLVTALESRDDKERGIESGANAYIVKSSFDQSNLLEVVRKFI